MTSAHVDRFCASTRRCFSAAFVVLALWAGAGCASLGIPTTREYTGPQARALLDGALEESLLLVSLAGSTDEQNGARLVQNLLLQTRALQAGVVLEEGNVYLKEDVHACMDLIRSLGIGLGAVTTPEAVVLPAASCDIPAQ